MFIVVNVVRIKISPAELDKNIEIIPVLRQLEIKMALSIIHERRPPQEREGPIMERTSSQLDPRLLQGTIRIRSWNRGVRVHHRGRNRWNIRTTRMH